MVSVRPEVRPRLFHRRPSAPVFLRLSPAPFPAPARQVAVPEAARPAVVAAAGEEGQANDYYLD